MISVLLYEGGRTRRVERVEPAWLDPDSGVFVWVDLAAPADAEAALLANVFGFHELAVQDALSAQHHPKVESYGSYVYLILHGIAFQRHDHRFATHDVDFFMGPNYLVTAHDGTSRSVPHVQRIAEKNDLVLREGAFATAHRILHVMIEHYEPEVDALRDQIDQMEQEVFERATPQLMREILSLKRDVASLRSVVLAQRDVVARLARREFPMVEEAMTYRFRDLHDQLVRLSDTALHFQDRISSLLEAHLASVSNGLNEVMKVLTLIATVFMPLTVLTSVYGMNVLLPHLPGGEHAQFWWVLGMMTTLSAGMLAYFHHRNWL